MTYEKSCGAVVYKADQGQRVYLIEHMALGHTSIPKGHVEEGETEEQTALREIKEETNLDVKLDTRFRHTISYSPYPGIQKEVVFFIAEAVSDSLVNQECEVSALEWLPYEEACAAMTYDTDRETLAEAKKYLDTQKAQVVAGLSHVAIRTRNIMDSVRYYTEVLGLREAFRMHREDGMLATVYLYIAPGQYLELFSNGIREGVTGPDVIGMNHLCLMTKNIRQSYEAVQKAGGPLDTEIRRGQSQCWMFWTHDPDGTRIEIMEMPPESFQAQADRRLENNGPSVHDDSV